MKIVSFEFYAEDIPLRCPFVTSKRHIETLRDYVVKLTTDTGIIGYGSCAPTPVITGDTDGSIVCAFNDFYKPMLTGRELDPELLPEIQDKLVHNTSPKAAVDIAVYDLLSKSINKPLYEYLGNKNADTVLVTDATVSLGTPEAMIAQAKEHIRKGFNILKVKLGGSREDDVLRINALSKEIPDDVTVRLDANQAWSRDDSVYLCEYASQSGLNIELVEQPVNYEDVESLAYVTNHTSLPILADESVCNPVQAKRLLEMHGADMINIKLMKCGGIYEACKIADIAGKNGVECFMGCMMEGAVSVLAASHFASAYGITKVDLDSPFLCSFVPVNGDFGFDNQKIIIGHSDGLGVK